MSRMQTFHELHNGDVTLSEGRTVAEWTERFSDKGTYGGQVYHPEPMSSGQTISVKVLDKGKYHSPYLAMTITKLTPVSWSEGGKKYPSQSLGTWSLDTHTATAWVHRQPGEFKPWKDSFGDKHLLSSGDVVSMTLCPDRSLTVAINHREVPGIFTDLPEGPLYGTIWMAVKKIEIVQTVGKSIAIERFSVEPNSKKVINLEKNKKVKMTIPEKAFKTITNMWTKITDTFSAASKNPDVKGFSPIIEVTSNQPSQQPIIVDLPFSSVGGKKADIKDVKSMRSVNGGQWEMEGKIVDMTSDNMVKVEIQIPADVMRLLVIEATKPLDSEAMGELAEDLATASERFEVTFLIAQHEENPWNTLVQCCPIENWQVALTRMKEKGFTTAPAAEKSKQFSLMDAQEVEVTFTDDSDLRFSGEPVRKISFRKDGGEPENFLLKTKNTVKNHAQGEVMVTYHDGEDKKNVSLVISVKNQINHL